MPLDMPMLDGGMNNAPMMMGMPMQPIHNMGGMGDFGGQGGMQMPNQMNTGGGLMGPVPVMNMDQQGGMNPMGMMPQGGMMMGQQGMGGMPPNMGMMQQEPPNMPERRKNDSPKLPSIDPTSETFGLSDLFLQSLNINLPLIKELLVINVSIVLLEISY